MWICAALMVILSVGCAEVMPDWLSYTDEKGRKMEMKRASQPCPPTAAGKPTTVKESK